jgi:hypothetical protein
MSSLEIMIVLPANCPALSLRAEGRRFGLHKAAHAEQVMRQAHERGVLTDEMTDKILRAVDHDIRKTVQDLAKHLPEKKLVIFDKAARWAYRRHVKALAAAQ